MPDVITALHQKRQRLWLKEKRIREDADDAIAEVRGEILRIDKALETLNAAAQEYLCPHCKGTGTVRKADAAGQMEDWPCPKCRGTGVKEVSE